MIDVYIYNSLTRKKEKFEPVHPGFVGVYVCGPTVYGHAHLGHAKSYISFDVIVRYFRYLGYKVRYVQNITDVGHILGDAEEGEDRILKQARLEKLEPMEIAESYTRSYFEDMDNLNLLRPDISPRASGHIPEQIDLVKELVDKGHAYEKNGNVYFDVANYKAYGKLSGRKVEDLIAGVRVNVQDEKQNPADFALWKHADPEHIMQWNSPWGKGYPGWHVECSAMATKYLGQPLDIHGGGLENIFPHHECEIAQSEAVSDQPFARYWLHNNMVTIDGVKMGKSLGNSVTIKDIIKKYDPLAVRFFVLSSHYRSALDFSDAALEAAQKGLQKFQQGFVRVLSTDATTDGRDEAFEKLITAYETKFNQGMSDDFNTSRAIAALFDFIKDINNWLDKNSNPSKETLAWVRNILEKTAGNVLGILPDDYDHLLVKNSGNISEIMDIILDIRTQLRKNKNFELADELRQKLAELKIEIKDTPQGPTWEQN
ncbi:MAG: cysteine--tRNA ligase [Calditrichaceae bacterium]|jgi:cysteinyl-tRNA synthetase